jgi:signal transduction histidine kinase
VIERDSRYFRFSVAPIASLEGSDRSGWVVLLLDVTQEKQAEQLKTEFLQTVAHDLRSPLASTMGFVELLSEGLAGELNDLQCEVVGEISSGLHRQLALIDSMLDVSRLESGRVSLNLSSFDLGELVQEVVRAHRLPAQQKEQTLSLGVPPEPLPVVADRLQMERVVTNLLSNAIKYTPLGGRVEVVVERHGAALRVAVKDTGYGISLADQQRLGEKFFRAQNEGLRQVKGTGLGLAITKTILAQHGSALQVESELGQGSTFSFTLAGAAGSA